MWNPFKTPPIKTIETSGQMRFQRGFKYLLKGGVTGDEWWVMTPIKGFEVTFRGFGQLYKDGKLSLRFGWGWDGPSGPTWDTKSSLPTSAVHDFFYLCTRKGWLPINLKPEIDKFLMDLGRYHGMWFIRTRLWFRGVSMFAFGSARRQEDKDELAP